MGTNSTQIFGRFSRAYYLLAGMVLAPVALVLVMAFADAKPAQAIGETWYGTVEFQGTGKTITRGDGSTVSDRSYVRYEAPRDVGSATLYAKADMVESYPAPAPGPGTCKVIERRVYGSGRATGHVSVSDAASDGFYSINAAPDSDTLMRFTQETTMAGQNADGTDCAETLYGNESWYMWGSIRSTQDANKPSFRGGSILTQLPPENNNCYSAENVGRECAEMFPLGGLGVQARWQVARNECSGYSRSWNIGKDDTLLLFNTCQTKSTSTRISWLDNVAGTPEVCDLAFVTIKDSMADWLKKRLNNACTGYKAVLRTQWAQNTWFLSLAANSDSCGLWVVDRASWRPPKLKPASYGPGPGSTHLGNIESISPGTTTYVKTATGSIPVTCPG